MDEEDRTISGQLEGVARKSESLEGEMSSTREAVLILILLEVEGKQNHRSSGNANLLNIMRSTYAETQIHSSPTH